MLFRLILNGYFIVHNIFFSFVLCHRVLNSRIKSLYHNGVINGEINISY